MPNPAFVQGAVGNGTGTGVTTFSTTFPSNVSAGHSVLVFITGSRVNGPVINSVIDNQGNNYALVGSAPAGGSGSGNITFAYFFSGITAGSLTITVNYASATGFTIMHVREYSGAPNVLLFAFSNGASGTALNSGNAVTFGPNQMLVGCGFTQATAAVLTAGTGFGNLVSGGSQSNFVSATEDLLEASQGTFSTSFTANASSDWACVLVALGAPPATLRNGEVVLGTNGGAGNIIGTSGGLSGTTNALVFDANSWTQWLNPDASGDYVGVDCGAAIACDHVLFSFNNPTYYTALVPPATAQFQASNDPAFGTFTTLFTFSNATVPLASAQWGSLNNSITFPLAGYYRYYRITLPAASSAPADLEFYGSYYSGVNATCAPVAITNANGTTGGYFDLPVAVSMSSPTTGAAIYYTVDGSTPTTASILYTGTIIISSNTVINAIAVLTGLSNSRVTLASYHINSLVPGDINYQVNRGGYRIWSIAGDKFQDPNPSSATYGMWFWYGMNSDQNGVFEAKGGGIDCYSSPDLCNWSFASNCNNIAEAAAQFNRVSVVYNAANNNYVLWTQQALSANAAVFTSPSPSGPWTQSGSTITSMDGYPTQGDFKLFVDSDGTCYLIIDDNSGWHIVIHKLNSAYTASSGTFVVYNNNIPGTGNGNNTPFGQQSEGFAMVKIGGTYYWQASNLSPWTPGLNLYVTNTTGPLGTWSAPINPFQADPNQLTDGSSGFWGPGPLTPSNQYAFDSQTDGLYVIPGRQGINPGTAAVIYIGDRWDFRNFGIIQTNSDSFQGWRSIMLPVAVNPTTGALSISWSTNWTFNGTFPQNTGMPAAPSGLSLSVGNPSGVKATWVNNEIKACALYLDRAANLAFSTNVISIPLSSGATSATDASAIPATQGYYYRVRAVNASGSSVSAIVGFGNLPQMIEDYVDNAIVALLQATTTGINIFRGLESESPILSLPAIVVHSEYEVIWSNHSLYKCRVAIEYKSIPDENSAASVDAAMAQIDIALTTQPSPSVLATLPMTGISELYWKDIRSTQQNVVTDRRTNVRELEAYLLLISS